MRPQEQPSGDVDAGVASAPKTSPIPEWRDSAALVDAKRLPPLLRIRVALEIWLTYGHVRWLLLRHPIADVVGALRKEAPDSLPLLDAYRLGSRLGSPVVRTLNVLPWDSRCLMRSLVMLRMMARRGVACQLVLGARTEKSFTAHAWVEHKGEPLLPTLGYETLTVL